MTALELFAILVLAGAVIILLYYYLQENRRLNLSGVRSQATEVGQRVYGEASNIGEKISKGDSMSGMGEKINVSGVSEKVTGVGEKIRGKVNVPISTDTLSNKIDLFLNEKSDQLISDWDLATKKDLSDLYKRYDGVSADLNALEKRFKNYKEATDKKLEDIEDRILRLENPKEQSGKSSED